MAQDEAQQERRRDSVAISRTTVKAASWLASISFVGVSTFIWNLGTQMDVLNTQLNVMEQRVATLAMLPGAADHSVLVNTVGVLEFRVSALEGFAKAGDRFTAAEGSKLEKRVEKMEKICSDHRDLTAHREQKQLNREIFWRLEKLEKPGSDNGTGVYRQ